MLGNGGEGCLREPDVTANEIRRALEGYPAVKIRGGPVETIMDALDTIWLLAYFAIPRRERVCKLCR